jgi:DNA-binding CsgD family transcriptional regulator
MVRNRLIRNTQVASGRGGVDALYEEDRADGTPVWMNPEAMVEMSGAETVREQALAELTEPCRTAYLLVREKVMTYRDVAAKLDISVGTVANYVKNAEQHLASRMLGRRVTSRLPRRVGHRAVAPRRRASGEAPPRRVVSAAHAGATVRSTRTTVKLSQPRQMHAEATALHSRPIANVAEPTSNYERARPPFE